VKQLSRTSLHKPFARAHFLLAEELRRFAAAI
jgi:hypothetical protein